MSLFFESGQILLPDRIPFKPGEYVSWERAIKSLERLGAELCKTFIASYLPAVSDHSSARLRAAVELVLSNAVGTEKLRVALLGAVVSDHLGIVVTKEGNCAYEIVHEFWGESKTLAANPVVLALTGRLALTRELLQHGSIEADLAGGHLYLSKPVFNKLTKAPVGSSAAHERSARELIDKHITEYPRDPLTKPEFLERIWPLFPGAGETPLVRAFNRVKPREWSKPGRRRRRS